MCSIGAGDSGIPVRIRPVEEKDRWEVIALGSREFPYIEHPDAFFLERMHRYYFFIAEVDGKFAGFIDMEPSLEDEHTAIIAGFAVRPEMRGKGIGKKLFEFAIRFLRATGFRRAIIYSKKDNDVANAIYKKHGFQVTKEHEGILKWEMEL
ncbi:MAG: hypothetical protein PWP76_514 [Candidatus Diapherotrites archaeon]|nr:hypothetical protein [Candidatus Diapherotrites archaeon]MDN5367083.1 hypothetical protein [Candidatus Diapherotrites archaeon]